MVHTVRFRAEIKVPYLTLLPFFEVFEQVATDSI